MGMRLDRDPDQPVLVAGSPDGIPASSGRSRRASRSASAAGLRLRLRQDGTATGPAARSPAPISAGGAGLRRIGARRQGRRARHGGGRDARRPRSRPVPRGAVGRPRDLGGGGAPRRGAVVDGLVAAGGVQPDLADAVERPAPSARARRSRSSRWPATASPTRGSSAQATSRRSCAAGTASRSAPSRSGGGIAGRPACCSRISAATSTPPAPCARPLARRRPGRVAPVRRRGGELTRFFAGRRADPRTVAATYRRRLRRCSREAICSARCASAEPRAHGIVHRRERDEDASSSSRSFSLSSRRCLSPDRGRPFFAAHRPPLLDVASPGGPGIAAPVAGRHHDKARRV